MKKTNNKGFSLVELIIVVAIMAVLVGVLAPQYIKYLDKSKASADKQVADALYQALTTTAMDPDFANAAGFPTANDTTWVSLADGTNYGASSKFWDEIESIVGPSSTTDLKKEFKLKVSDIAYMYKTNKTFQIRVQYSSPDNTYDFFIE